jgi:predicted Zn-dependent protease
MFRILPLLLAGAAIAVPVATVPPAFAQGQVRSLSETDRAQGAAAHPKLVAQYGGAYNGPQAAFVRRVGQRIAVESGLSNKGSDFTVTMLDSPVENAFAIPGGYICMRSATSRRVILPAATSGRRSGPSWRQGRAS